MNVSPFCIDIADTWVCTCMWVYTMTLQQTDRTCVVVDWVRQDHPRTTAKSSLKKRETKEWRRINSILPSWPFLLIIQPRVLRLSFYLLIFFYSCSIWVDVPGRIIGSILFMWQTHSSTKLVNSFTATSCWRNLSADSPPPRNAVKRLKHQEQSNNT
jgi:hypothetical protein